MPRDGVFKQTRCAVIDAFSLRAAARCDADDRRALEQPWRHVARPTLANNRAQCNTAGKAALQLKAPWCDGASHPALPPPEFMQLCMEGSVRGGQIQWFYDCSGSIRVVDGQRERSLAMRPRASRKARPTDRR